MILRLAACALLVAACSARTEPCPPDGGCFCYRPADVDACGALGLVPFCCTDHGGAIVECGQPPGCIPKPGIEAAGAEGANWCCLVADGG